MLRILVIARFIREEPECTFKAYEKFVDRARASEKSFLFEKVAHVGSSFILSPALCFLFELRNPLFSKQWEPVLCWGILGFWFIGIACILTFHNEFERRTGQMAGG